MSRTHTMQQSMTTQRTGARIEIGYKSLRMYEAPGSEQCEPSRVRSRGYKSKTLQRWSDFYRSEQRLMGISSTYAHDWVWDTDTPTVYCSRCEVVLESNGQEFNPSELCEVK